uniref:Uncharacterized protein n=1 Tax=Fagus sylvatica TaxID=28930 RepID=A0A2N9H1J9_FAGSY
MNGGYFRASKLRQARQASELELPSIQSSNHLNHWLPTRHHARPSHHDLRNRRSRHLLRPRPPPTDRSSPDLLLYGGKKSNGEDTRSHALEKKPATLFTRLVPPHLLKLRTGASQLRFKKMAPLLDSLEDDLPFGGGNASIGGSTRLHAPMGTPASPFTRHRGLRTQ